MVLSEKSGSSSRLTSTQNFISPDKTYELNSNYNRNTEFGNIDSLSAYGALKYTEKSQKLINFDNFETSPFLKLISTKTLDLSPKLNENINLIYNKRNTSREKSSFNLGTMKDELKYENKINDFYSSMNKSSSEALVKIKHRHISNETHIAPMHHLSNVSTAVKYDIFAKSEKFNKTERFDFLGSTKTSSRFSNKWSLKSDKRKSERRTAKIDSFMKNREFDKECCMNQFRDIFKRPERSVNQLKKRSQSSTKTRSDLFSNENFPQRICDLKEFLLKKKSETHTDFSILNSYQNSFGNNEDLQHYGRIKHVAKPLYGEEKAKNMEQDSPDSFGSLNLVQFSKPTLNRKEPSSFRTKPETERIGNNSIHNPGIELRSGEGDGPGNIAPSIMTFAFPQPNASLPNTFISPPLYNINLNINQDTSSLPLYSNYTNSNLLQTKNNSAEKKSQMSEINQQTQDLPSPSYPIYHTSSKNSPANHLANISKTERILKISDRLRKIDSMKQEVGLYSEGYKQNNEANFRFPENLTFTSPLDLQFSNNQDESIENVKKTTLKVNPSLNSNELKPIDLVEWYSKNNKNANEDKFQSIGRSTLLQDQKMSLNLDLSQNELKTNTEKIHDLSKSTDTIQSLDETQLRLFM